MTTEVRHVPEGNRYELRRDGAVVGRADYVARGDVLVFTHTEVDRSLRGRGLGDVLVRGALDDVRERGLQALPQCWFVGDVMRARPEYARLLPPAYRAAFGAPEDDAG